MAINTQTLVFGELADFLLTQPAPEEIVEYRLPEALERRAHALLDKNREMTLTREEREEFNHFMSADHFMTVMKAKARLKLSGKA
jgi:hypothetical protein